MTDLPAFGDAGEEDRKFEPSLGQFSEILYQK